MKINIDFQKENTENYKNEKLNSTIDLVNKIIKFIIQTSSLFTFLSILVTISNILYSNFEIQKFKFLYDISIIIGFGAFYLIIFGIFPIIGFLTLMRFLNKVYNLEITKINFPLKQLKINITLLIVAIIALSYLNYSLLI